MKAAAYILIIYAAFLLVWPVNTYCEDSASSGVVVIGPAEKSSSQTQSSDEKSSNEATVRMGVSGLDSSPIPLKNGTNAEEIPKVKISGSPDNSSSRLMFEISGSKIGNTKVSQQVSLPSEGVVMFVEPGVSRSFVIVRVEDDGKETLALNAEPERAIGARLPRGIYKVYPQDLDGAFASEKLTVKVRIGLVESKIGEAQ